MYIQDNWLIGRIPFINVMVGVDHREKYHCGLFINKWKLRDGKENGHPEIHLDKCDRLYHGKLNSWHALHKEYE